MKGKRGRKDAQGFERHLMSNLFSLHDRLASKTYRHSGYEAFAVSDPKPRSIHKATVEDRVLHRALYRKLCPFFDRTFIADSFSCRIDKGAHSALDRFRAMAWEVSRNHTRTCWVLKCDVRKFFASIDHGVLLEILTEKIGDAEIMWLVRRIVESFSSGQVGTGLPLGNLTSQLFANVYMNELDQFVKRQLKVRHYIRYADDFAFLSEDRFRLAAALPKIAGFLRVYLKLDLHPDKVFVKTVASGVDFLGWVHFTDHRVVRTTTKRRMFRRLEEGPTRETLASYLGMVGHGNAERLRTEIQDLVRPHQGTAS